MAYVHTNIYYDCLFYYYIVYTDICMYVIYVISVACSKPSPCVNGGTYQCNTDTCLCPSTHEGTTCEYGKVKAKLKVTFNK